MAKIGWDPTTRALIDQEATALRDAADLPAPFIVPNGRGVIDVGNLRVLALDPIDIPADRIDPVTIEAEASAILALGGSEWVQLADAPFLTTMTDRLVHHERGAELRGLVDRLVAVSGHDPVHVGRAHGDWAPGTFVGCRPDSWSGTGNGSLPVYQSGSILLIIGTASDDPDLQM